jgi:hypothetical protein
MQRKSTAALCLLAVAILVACTRNGPPNSLFESAGYHIGDGKVYYLNAFPGKAFEINDADAATFKALDSTFGRDESHVFINGLPLPDADVATFELLDRPGFAKDSNHVFQRDRAISDDPAQFELLDGELAKDSHAVYWSDGSVLSEDPTNFAIVSNADHYLYTKDGRTVHATATRSPTPIPRHSKSCKALTRATVNASSTSTTRSPKRTPRRFGRSRAPMRATPRTSTGWARRSTAPTQAPSGY